MNIRQAILKAADQIERDPGSYRWWTFDQQPCGTPMCMFGWIGHFMGMPVGVWNTDVAKQIGLRFTDELYEFVTGPSPDRDWRKVMKTDVVAASMRRFADARYPAPAESREPIPASVMAIFSMSNADLKREFERA